MERALASAKNLIWNRHVQMGAGFRSPGEAKCLQRVEHERLHLQVLKHHVHGVLRCCRQRGHRNLQALVKQGVRRSTRICSPRPHGVVIDRRSITSSRLNYVVHRACLVGTHRQRGGTGRHTRHSRELHIKRSCISLQ